MIALTIAPLMKFLINLSFVVIVIAFCKWELFRMCLSLLHIICL